MMADERLRNGAHQVFEIAFQELFIEGKHWDADVKYSLPYDQRNADEDTTGDPVEQVVDLVGVPLRWVACFDGALLLLRLGLLGLLVFAVCSEQERSGRGKRFAIWARHNRSYRNKWFKLASLALLIPRAADAQTYFTVSSGPCTVDPSSPNCIRSPNFPYANYANNERCVITPTALAIGAPLTATAFRTEANFDYLKIPSYSSGTLTWFHGTSGPSNFVLGGSPGSIEWSTDYSVTASGWKVCSYPTQSRRHRRRRRRPRRRRHNRHLPHPPYHRFVHPHLLPRCRHLPHSPSGRSPCVIFYVP